VHADEEGCSQTTSDEEKRSERESHLLIFLWTKNQGYDTRGPKTLTMFKTAGFRRMQFWNKADYESRDDNSASMYTKQSQNIQNKTKVMISISV
jgi:hypothetical protein